MSTFPLANRINYLNKDYLTIRDELLQKIPVITQGKWTDLNSSDPGIALVELYISMVDILLFYLDQTTQELYLPTATQRANVINQLRLIGYEFSGNRAARGTATLQVDPKSFPAFPVAVLKGTQLSAVSNTGAETILFSTTEDIVLSSRSDQKAVSVIQGTYATESFVSDGSPSQLLQLGSESIDKTTVIVSIDESATDTEGFQTWSSVTSFYASTSESLHYKLELDEFSKVYIVFGDGQFGKIPPAGANIVVNYIITDGSLGNLGRNAINKVSSGTPFVSDAALNGTNLVVVSSEATAGGSETESIEEAKEQAVGLLFALNRALSRDDFVILIESIAGITDAIAWGESEEDNPDYRLLNLVRTSFFAPQFADMYYNPASRASYIALRDNQVKTLLKEKIPITTRVSFIDPVLQDVFVWVEVGIDTTQYDPNLVIGNVKYVLADNYSYENIKFGQDVRISEILKLVNSVEGVSWATIRRLHNTTNESVPDTAPYPPEDIIFEKWKIPIIIDSTTSTTVTTTAPPSKPYIAVSLPESFVIGLQDVTVLNPDEQLDIFTNGFTYFPSTNIEHIKVTYTSIYDGPNSTGGFYGNPNPYSDAGIFVSNK